MRTLNSADKSLLKKRANLFFSTAKWPFIPAYQHTLATGIGSSARRPYSISNITAALGIPFHAWALASDPGKHPQLQQCY